MMRSARVARAKSRSSETILSTLTPWPINFVARDRRAFGNVARGHGNAELPSVRSKPPDLLEFGRIRPAAPFGIVFVKQIDARNERNFRHRIFALPPPRSMVSILQAAILRAKVFCEAASAPPPAARWYPLLSVSDDR